MKNRFTFTKKKVQRGGSSMIIFTMKDTILDKEYSIRFDGKAKRDIPFGIYFKTFLAYEKKSRKLFLEAQEDISALNGNRAYA